MEMKPESWIIVALDGTSIFILHTERSFIDTIKNLYKDDDYNNTFISSIWVTFDGYPYKCIFSK